MVDTVWSDTKPVLIVIIYAAFCLLLSTYLLIKGSATIKTSSLLLLLFPCTLLVSQFNSNVGLLDHIKFSLQVFVPCAFLVASTSMPRLMHEVGLTYKRRLSIIFFLTLSVATYTSYSQNSLPGESIYEHYQNAPDHVIAQTLLKSSLPLITSGLLWVAIPFIMVILLNVRSVMLAYLLSIAYVNKGQLLKKKTIKYFVIIGIPIIAYAVSQVDWIEFYNRTIFKGRDVANDTSLTDAASSGRLSIYQYYISYIADNFGMKELLFGVGPIWLQPGGPSLSAHSDFLNLLVSFGAIGLASTLFCYLYFFSKLPSTGRLIFFVVFAVLFLTNGVVFHQSNVLFSLLFVYLNIPARNPLNGRR